MRKEKGYLEVEEFVLDCQRSAEKTLGNKADEQKNYEAHCGFLFWRLIKKYSNQETLQERREFLRRFVNNSNRYIALVAMIESLPVSIWRRILWRHNINYESLFSFLRRISSENMQAIKKNYLDLCIKDKQPRILKFYEKWRKKFSVQSLLEEQEDLDLRNKRKGSWSYNFLGLDFGFNAYTDDLNNDELTEAKTWSDFLSIKNHAKDFIVNREFGKYWWLYRTARSNWGWKRNKVVKLSNHICPGFWYTLFVHFLFWIASPFALFYVLTSGFEITGSDVFYKIPLLWAALFTPLWAVIAMLWSFFRLAFPLARRKKISEKFNSFKETEIYQKLKEYIVATLFVLVAILLFSFIWKFFYLCFGSLIGSGLLTLLLVLYFGTHVIEERPVCFSERSVIFQIIYASTACYIFTLFFIHFGHHAEKIMNFIFSFLFSLGTTGVILAIFFLFPLLVIVMLEYLEKNRIFKKMLNFSAILVLAMRVFSVVLVGITISTLIKTIKAIEFSGALFTSIIMIFFFGVVYCYLLHELFNYLLRKDADVEYTFMAHPGSKFVELKPFTGLELRWYLRNNKLWRLLELDDRTDLLNQAYELAFIVSQWSGDEKAYLKKLLPVLSYTMIGKIKNANLGEISSGKERNMVFDFMIGGMSFEKARKLSREKIKDKEKRSEKINRVISLSSWPFYWVYEKLSQLIWLKKKFHEMCPFVMREGKIDMYN
jgi:hypothetical protein